MMAKFEDQLLDDLMRSHGSTLDTLPDRAASAGRRGIGRTLGIGGTALGVAGALAVTGTLLAGGPAAYAVTTGADGVVTVSISDVSGVTGANEELRRLGVRAVAVPMRDGCVDLGSLPIDTADRGGGTSSTVDAVDGHTGSMTFDPGGIPEGVTLLLAATTESSSVVALGAVLIKGPVPECVSVQAPPAGGKATPAQGG